MYSYLIYTLLMYNLICLVTLRLGSKSKRGDETDREVIPFLPVVINLISGGGDQTVIKFHLKITAMFSLRSIPL